VASGVSGVVREEAWEAKEGVETALYSILEANVERHALLMGKLW